MTITLAGYYNRFDEQWDYEDILFRAGLGLQSAELNEVQSLQSNRLRKIADVLFADGEVVRGGPPAINSTTGVTTVGAAVVYIAGIMRNVPERTFTIPIVGTIQIGVYIFSEVVTEDDTGVGEPGLRDPAVATRNFNEPGAARLRETATWGFSGDGQPGVLYPVWTVVDGVIQGQGVAEGNPFIDLLARYDRESNGSYIVSGLSVSAINPDTFSVREGVGNIFGYKLDIGATSRLVFPPDPELEDVTSEPDVYVNNSTNIQLNRTPVESIVEVVVTQEKTVSITRGGSSGGSDLMPDVSIISVQSITQGGTTYTAPADYLLNGDTIEWSPGGAEPAPGSTYSITYRYLSNVSVNTVDLTAGTFRVAAAVPGTLVLTDYRWKVPRYDRLCLGRNGIFTRVKGIPSRYSPVPPRVPSNLLSLATIYQTWKETPPTVTNDGIRAIPFDQIDRMRSMILDLFDLVSQERLLRDVATREPTTKRGVFVDPFFDHDLRDAGRQQTAAIADETLMLPVLTEAILLPSANNAQDWMLPYTEEVILQQTLETGSERINPYANFDLAPARARISPERNRWVNTVQASVGVFDPANQRRLNDTWMLWWLRLWRAMNPITLPRGITSRLGRLNRRNRVANDLAAGRPEESGAITTIPETEIEFFLSLFGPGETLGEVTFAGVPVTTTPGTITANGSGVLSGKFTIPEGLPPGRHRVGFTGAGGSFAEAFYFGEIITEVAPAPRPRVTRLIDPLAQTFRLEEGRYITSVDIGVRTIGSTSNAITVQIRDVDLGIPTAISLAEGSIPGDELSATGWTTVELERPLWVPADQEFAIVVLTDDSAHAVAIAQLGKFDIGASRWVTSQPYTIGTLLKSSNASTWTPFQEADMTFRLNAASFTATTRTVDLGPVYRVEASGITRSGSTATVTVDTSTFETGQTVIFSGADQSEYNVAAVVTVTGPNSLTYPVAGSPATPATGELYLAPGLTSDLGLLATVERPTGGVDVEFVFSRTGAADLRTTDNGYIELPERVTTGLNLSMVLTGTATESPFVFGGVQVVLGNLQESGVYITRAIPSAADAKVVTTFDQFIPASATAAVAIEKADLSWLSVSQDETVELGDGWLEASHIEPSFTAGGVESRVRLTLTGNPANRPYIKNLRVVTV